MDREFSKILELAREGARRKSGLVSSAEAAAAQEAACKEDMSVDAAMEIRAAYMSLTLAKEAIEPTVENKSLIESIKTARRACNTALGKMGRERIYLPDWGKR